MMTGLKEKANNLKDETVKATGQAKDYFSELSKKGTDAIKEHFPGAEKWMNDVFGNKSATDNTTVHTEVVPPTGDFDKDQPNTTTTV